jgi:predicted transcriptional regulator
MKKMSIQSDVMLGSELPEPSNSQVSGNSASALARGLGWREQEIMKILWTRGSASVLEVTQSLSSALAYTTVMTTLDRLFKKGLLQREKKDRAFIYSATLSPREVEKQRAAGLIRRLFAESRERPEILLSCLVDAVDQYDVGLLDELEARIKLTREQAAKSGSETEDLR